MCVYPVLGIKTDCQTEDLFIWKHFSQSAKFTHVLSGGILYGAFRYPVWHQEAKASKASLQKSTCLVWPNLWIRAWACKSIWGFQSLSYMMAVSAACRLSPTPPVLMLRRNTKMELSGWLNLSTMQPRSSEGVDPSILTDSQPLQSRTSSMMSRVFVEVQNISTWGIYKQW